MDTHGNTSALVQLFAKPPVIGNVKTRLIPELGESIATDIYRYCLEYALRLVGQSGIDYQLWLSEESEDSIFRNNSYRLQRGNDLGSRMLSAIKSELDPDGIGKSEVILIGSDCLDLKSAHLLQAINVLGTHDIVFLPTFDGGFALIGCRFIDAGLFSHVEWGQEQVLDQTLENAKSLGYRVCLLETVRDIDTLQDVSHYSELKSLIPSN